MDQSTRDKYEVVPFYAVAPGQVIRRCLDRLPCMKLAVSKSKNGMICNARVKGCGDELARFGEEEECILCNGDGTPKEGKQPTPKPFDLDVAVEEFHGKHDVKRNISPRIPHMTTASQGRALFMEELGEYFTAIPTCNLVDIADALADMGYTLFGLANRYGIKLMPLIEEVHKSNMTKDVDTSNNGKIQKGENYVAPDIEGILRRQGWQG